MLTDLDAPSSRDPVKVGEKAAALAAARAAGAAVLPGFVVEAATSVSHLRLGARTLPDRGSGGARLAVTARPLEFADQLVDAGSQLGDCLVARSSTLLEVSGEWSGAFASYVDLTPRELPKAVVGCWASAFTVAALERQEAAGVEPGEFPMAVLVQPALQPEAGGWARLEDDGVLEVFGVKGSPAPLLQGWDSGHEARHDGAWSGQALIDLVGVNHLEAIRTLMTSVNAYFGANRCEWALADRVWALQIGRVPGPGASTPRLAGGEHLEDLIGVAAAVTLAPGPLGEEMVLPWGIAGISADIGPIGSRVPLDRMRQICRELTEEVWGLPWVRARSEVGKLMNDLRSGADVIPRLRNLRPPDPRRASLLVSSLRSLRLEMVKRGVVADERAAWQLDLDSIELAIEGGSITVPPRLGIGRWEPLVAAVVLSSVAPLRGTPASPGIGAGPRSEVEDSHRRHPRRRDILTAGYAAPNLASLIWDAAGVVTRSGSPAAHLFEAARALRIPAVCGVDLGPAGHEVLAIDGSAGLVARLDLERSL